MPLVGNQVIDLAHEVVPLSTFQEVSKLEDILIWPVGSKGILMELNQMFPTKEFSKEMLCTELDIVKSSGPATSFIIAFEQCQEEYIKRLTAKYFHSIDVK
jgi:hypothetical protein